MPAGVERCDICWDEDVLLADRDCPFGGDHGSSCYDCWETFRRVASNRDCWCPLDPAPARRNPGEDDQTSERFIRDNLKRGRFRKCPCCRVLVEKNGGCSFVRCANCCIEFDWRHEDEDGIFEIFGLFGGWRSSAWVAGNRVFRIETANEEFFQPRVVRVVDCAGREIRILPSRIYRIGLKRTSVEFYPNKP